MVMGFLFLADFYGFGKCYLLCIPGFGCHKSLENGTWNLFLYNPCLVNCSVVVRRNPDKVKS